MGFVGWEEGLVAYATVTPRKIDPAFCPKIMVPGSQTNFKVIFARMPMIQVKVINNRRTLLPAYATGGSSGMDVRTDLNLPLTLAPSAVPGPDRTFM